MNAWTYHLDGGDPETKNAINILKKLGIIDGFGFSNAIEYLNLKEVARDVERMYHMGEKSSQLENFRKFLLEAFQ